MPGYSERVHEDHQNLLGLREILSAYVAVSERSDELLRVCAGVSGDGDAARRAVAEAFDVSETAAAAILDMQVKRFTPAAVEQIRAELADVDRRLAEL